jgi:hypothetical protein
MLRFAFCASPILLNRGGEFSWVACLSSKDTRPLVLPFLISGDAGKLSQFCQDFRRPGKYKYLAYKSVKVPLDTSGHARMFGGLVISSACQMYVSTL